MTISDRRPHVALLPSSGAGHITPFLRLAATLLAKNIRVTLITSHPIVTDAESSLISNFLAAFPQVSEQQFHILPIDPSTANSTDPFFLQWESIRRSLHLLSSILSSISPPPAALISDITLISSTISVSQELKLPNYVLFTSSARMLSLVTRYPAFTKTQIESADTFPIPGIGDLPRSSIPPLLLKPESLFATMFKSNSENLRKFDGILINTFDRLELEALSAIRTGEVADGLPDLFNVGLIPHDFERKSSVGGGRTEQVMKWLDGKEQNSVVYVSFGSRTALSRDQIKELGKGLVKSGFGFIWVMKDKVVDKEDGERLEDVLGEEMMKEVGERGLVVKEWVDQVEVIGHDSVGGFVSHCGWNSVVEAAWAGVPVLAWPLHGDQRINGEVVERCGLGFVGGGNWGLGLVKGGEIGVKIKELMEDEKVRELAKEIKEEVRKDVGLGGRCDLGLDLLVEKWSS
ncbi:UDP-glycosyltransferase 708G1 [Linum grandiflorum]